MKFKKALAVTLAATTVLTSANVTGLITPVSVEAAVPNATKTFAGTLEQKTTPTLVLATGSASDFSYNMKYTDGSTSGDAVNITSSTKVDLYVDGTKVTGSPVSVTNIADFTVNVSASVVEAALTDKIGCHVVYAAFDVAGDGTGGIITYKLPSIEITDTVDDDEDEYQLQIKGNTSIKVGEETVLSAVVSNASTHTEKNTKSTAIYKWGTKVGDDSLGKSKTLKYVPTDTEPKTIYLTVIQSYVNADGEVDYETLSTKQRITADKVTADAAKVLDPTINTLYYAYGGDKFVASGVAAQTTRNANDNYGGTWDAADTSKELKTTDKSLLMKYTVDKATFEDKYSAPVGTTTEPAKPSENVWYTDGTDYWLYRTLPITVSEYKPHVATNGISNVVKTTLTNTNLASPVADATNDAGYINRVSSTVTGAFVCGDANSKIVIEPTVTADVESSKYYNAKGGSYTPSITYVVSGKDKDAINLVQDGAKATITAVKAVANPDIKITIKSTDGTNEKAELVLFGAINQGVNLSELSFVDVPSSGTIKRTYDSKNASVLFADLKPESTEKVSYASLSVTSDDKSVKKYSGTIVATLPTNSVLVATPSARSSAGISYSNNTVTKTYTNTLEITKKVITQSDLEAEVAKKDFKAEYEYGTSLNSVFSGTTGSDPSYYNTSDNIQLQLRTTAGANLTLDSTAQPVGSYSYVLHADASGVSTNVEIAEAAIKDYSVDYVVKKATVQATIDGKKTDSSIQFTTAYDYLTVGASTEANLPYINNSSTDTTTGNLYSNSSDGAADNENRATYQWYNSEGAIVGATAYNYRPTKDGVYYAKVTIAQGTTGIDLDNLSGAKDVNASGTEIEAKTYTTPKMTVSLSQTTVKFDGNQYSQVNAGGATNRGTTHELEDQTVTAVGTDKELDVYPSYALGGSTGAIEIKAPTTGGYELNSYKITIEGSDGTVYATKEETGLSVSSISKTVAIPKELECKKADGTSLVYYIRVQSSSSKADGTTDVYDSKLNGTSISFKVKPYTIALPVASDISIADIVYGGNYSDAVITYTYTQGADADANAIQNKYVTQVVDKIKFASKTGKASSVGDTSDSVEFVLKDTISKNFDATALTSAGANVIAGVNYKINPAKINLSIVEDAEYVIGEGFNGADYVIDNGYVGDDTAASLEVVYYVDIYDANDKAVDRADLKAGTYKVVPHAVDEEFSDNYTFASTAGVLTVKDPQAIELAETKEDLEKAEADAKAQKELADKATEAQTKAENDAKAQKDAATAAAQKQAEAEEAQKKAEDDAKAAAQKQAEAEEAQKKAEDDAKAAAEKAQADVAAAQKAQKEAEAKAAAATTTATTAQQQATTAQVAADATTAVGAEALVGKTAVTVTAADAVQVTGATSSKVTIGKTVTINGKTFTVASIAKNAFKGSAATVTIKNTSVTIAKNAFKSFKGKVVLSKKLSTKAKKSMVKKLTKAGVKKSQISYK